MKYLLTLLLFPTVIFSQSEFVKSNHSGINANAAYFQSDSFQGVGYNFGLSVHGKIDLGLEYLQGTFDNKNLPFDVSNRGIAVYAGYNIKKKNDTENFKLSIGYLSNDYSGAPNSSGLLFGVRFSKNYYENKSILFLPSFGHNYGIFFVDDGNNSHLVESSNAQTIISLSLDLNLVLKISPKFRFLLAPTASFDMANQEKTLVWGIVGGIIIDFAPY